MRGRMGSAYSRCWFSQRPCSIWVGRGQPWENGPLAGLLNCGVVSGFVCIVSGFGRGPFVCCFASSIFRWRVVPVCRFADPLSGLWGVRVMLRSAWDASPQTARTPHRWMVPGLFLPTYIAEPLACGWSLPPLSMGPGQGACCALDRRGGW